MTNAHLALKLPAGITLACLLTSAACSSPRKDADRTAHLDERRAAAEWEPAIGVLISYPFAHPPELVQEWVRDTQLYVVVANDSKRDAARKKFEEWGSDLTRVRFILRPTKEGLYGTRDWGAFAGFDESGVLTHRDGRYIDYALSKYDSTKDMTWWKTLQPELDWTSDDETPAAVAAFVGCPRQELPFSFTGGNVYVDGFGTAFSTEIIVDENIALGVPRDRLLTAASETLGIRNFVLVPNFESSYGAQHIDCVMKLLTEEKILVKRAPADHPDHAQIEKIVAVLRGLTNPWGRPYEIVRIDADRYQGNNVANYTNSLILNKTIYVPLFDVPSDKTALDTWRQAMPGYIVKGFRGDPGTPWTFTDALHCRTKAIWDPKMIYLRHKTVASAPVNAPIAIEAGAWVYGGGRFADGGVKLYWRTRGDTIWTPLTLAPGVNPGQFGAPIPAPRGAGAIEYYLSATDTSGRVETHPRTAPAGFHTIRIGESPSR